MQSATKSAIDKRLARLEGQVSGLRRMVSEERYCLDIVTQISAVRSALDQVAAELVASHLQTCIVGHGTETEHEHCRPMSQEELIKELKTVLSRLV